MPRLRRALAPGLVAVRSEAFPSEWKCSRPLPRGREVWWGIGGNLGDVVRRFERLLVYLRRQRDLCLLESSPLLINPPFGYLDQPPFVNGVLRLRSGLPPLALLRRMQRIERHFGRRRSFKNAPRTLDLDLLFYEGGRIDHPRLKVPHPHWSERISVRWPLSRMRRLPPGINRRALVPRL